MERLEEDPKTIYAGNGQSSANILTEGRATYRYNRTDTSEPKAET